MRRFKFEKPLVESAYPPESKNVLWVDIHESTGSIISIKEFKNGDWVDIVSNQQLVDAGVDVNPNFPEPNEIYYYSEDDYPLIDVFEIRGIGDPDLYILDITSFTHPKWGDIKKITFSKSLPEEFPWYLFCGQSNSSDPPIRKIWLPKHTKYIPYASFYTCNELELVYLPEGLVGIGDKSFLGSSAKVNYMESGTYSMCFPSTIKYVGAEAFALQSLGSINFPETPDYISSFAFLDSDVLSIDIKSTSLYREENTFFGEVSRGTGFEGDAVHYSLEVSSSINGPECLLSGTQILVDIDGTTKNIEDLQIGDTVITYNKGKYVAAELDKVVDVKHNYYVDVVFEDDTKISISADHAILTEEGWKSYRPFLTETPENVQPFYTGDKVLVNGEYIKIKNIILYSKPDTVMYNIGVKGYNNYIANGVCVYECSGSN